MEQENQQEQLIVPVYLGENERPSLSELKAKAVTFLKENCPNEYKKMSPGEIQKYATAKASAAERYANNLMSSGEPNLTAWNRAIRLEILESESD